MALIEDYAFLGDTHSAALVSRDGSIDWLCLPRFDSSACLAAILDEQRGGHWRIAPASGDFNSERAYRHESMVLETVFTTSEGSVRLTDCLPIEQEEGATDPRLAHTYDVVVRIVEGLSGAVSMTMDFAPRFDYGGITPWIRAHRGVGSAGPQDKREVGSAGPQEKRGSESGSVEAVGGPDALDLQATVPLEVEGGVVSSSFDLRPGERVMFMARSHPSHLDPPELDVHADCDRLVDRTDRFWRDWAARCTYDGKWRPEVIRSLLVLKALTYSPTGGIVAAPTTSLPEDIGGVRNWDYRYCWLRDATFTLEVLLDHGFTSEASEWRDWLLRAVAGDPEELQIMYGVRGERRLTEIELPWLRGYENSVPVRIGNAAVEQFQLDVYGEIMDALHSAARAGNEPVPEAWELQSEIVEFVCKHWHEPDEGIWEVRSGRRHFVHSKVMAWVAVDRGISMIENFGRSGPLGYWKAVRSEIREEVFERGFDRRLGCFTRAYDDDSLDASLLLLPLVGFIDATDPRMVGTIEAIGRDLVVDGFVHRYVATEAADGLRGDEGSFLMCSFWLVDCLELIGRHAEAEEQFARLLSLRNDVGLLAEQYDAARERLVGNFPQAFSHV
ncbi:MAG: glycoside hydrolase family 15 protein, partial [Actinomycetota bacterium]|nr:glycoside hydrolase family 15 protein [Actinomycetota bacterium]